jgi:ADP-heptose:LPS heptosyltransferase
MNREDLGSLSARRIIVFRALYVGDLLCAVPAFRALRRRFPAAEVTLVGLPWARDFVDRMPHLDRLLLSPGFPGLPEVPYDPARTEAFYARVRREGYDLAIQLHGSGRSTNAMVAAFGARATIGFGVEGDERVTATVPWIEEENEVLRCLRPMSLVGAETDDVRIEFPTSIDEERAARALLGALPASRGPIVGFHAGAKDPRRRWPVEHFAALGDALGVRYGARIVLTGGPEDRALGQVLRRAMRVPPLDLTGQTDLGTFGALISRLDLLVTNDTGASHLAAATRTPSVVLFGFARPDRWAPLNRDLHTVIDAVTFGGVTRDPATALSELPLGPVLAACERVLGRRGGERRGVSPPTSLVAPGINLERVWGD